MIDSILKSVEADHEHAVARLCEFLRIASIGTDPAYADDTRQAAEWVAKTCADLNLDAKIFPTGGNPVVVAHCRPENVVDPDAPRILFYGHYDVQPPDPIELWTTPPFEPDVRDGHVYARGALDDKGQLMTFLEALRAWTRHGDGKLPGPVTVIIEGEEESGSANLAPFLEQHKDLLAADVCVVSDTSMWDENTAAITYALRGLVYFDVQLHGPSRDLHSGMYGGTLANPATILARVLGQLFDEHHRINIPGFYDDVDPLTEEERQRWAELGFQDEVFLGEIDARPHGEAGFSTLERRWARPSCDVNGLYGGYMGEGAKTVIPTFAGAKVSFRITASMDPHKVAQQFENWLRSHNVGDLEWKITSHGMARPVATSLDSPYMAAAVRAIETVFDKPPALIREGATIPVVADFKTILGLDTLLIGFGLESDAIHSPNERFGLKRFLRGCQTHAALLAEIAQDRPTSPGR